MLYSSLLVLLFGLSTEFNQDAVEYSKQQTSYLHEIDDFFESELSSYRSQYERHYDEIILSLSETEKETRDVLFKRYKKLETELPQNSIQRAEILFKLQVLSYEFSRAGQFTNDQPLFYYGQLLKKEFPNFHRLDLSFFLEAKAREAQKRFNEASKLYAQLIEEYPASQFRYEALNSSAKIFESQGKYAQALERLNQIPITKSSIYRRSVLFRKAVAYEKLHNFYGSLLSLCPLIEELGFHMKPEIRKLMHELKKLAAMNIIHGGGLEFGQKFFQRQFHDQEYDALYLAGYIFSSEKRYPQAVYTFRYLLSQYPDDPRNLETHKALVNQFAIAQNYRFYFKEVQSFVDQFGPRSAWGDVNKNRPDLLQQAERDVGSFRYELIQHLYSLAQKSGAPRDYLEVSVYYRDFLKQYQDFATVDRATFEYASSLLHSHQYAGAAFEFEFVIQRSEKQELVEPAVINLLQAYESILGERRKIASVGGRSQIMAMVDERGEKLPARTLIQEENAFIESLNRTLDNEKTELLTPLLLLKKAIVYFRNNQFNEAKPQLFQILQGYQGHSLTYDAIQILLEIFKLEKQWSDVEKWCREFIKRKKLYGKRKPATLEGSSLDDLLATSLFRQAEALEKAQNLQVSAQKYDSFYQLFPRMRLAAQAILNSASIQFQLGRFYEGVKRLNHLTLEYADTFTALQGLLKKADIYELIFDEDQKILALERVVRHFSHTPEALQSLKILGESYKREKNLEKYAETQLQLAERLQGSEQGAQALAEAIAGIRELGQIKRSAQLEQKYLKLYPDDIEQRIRIVSSRYFMLQESRPDEAKGALRELVQVEEASKDRKLSLQSRTVLSQVYLDRVKSDMTLLMNPKREFTAQNYEKEITGRLESIEKIKGKLRHIQDLKSPEETAKALLLEGDLYDTLADSIRKFEKATQVKSTEGELLSEKIREKLGPIDDRARETYKKAVELMKSEHVSFILLNEAQLKLRRYSLDTQIAKGVWDEYISVGSFDLIPYRGSYDRGLPKNYHKLLNDSEELRTYSALLQGNLDVAHERLKELPAENSYKAFLQWVEGYRSLTPSILGELKKEKTDEKAQYVMAQLAEQGHWQEIENLIRQLVPFQPYLSHWSTWMGWTKLMKGQGEESARYHFKKAIEINGGNLAMAYLGLGFLEEKAGHLGKAKDHYQSALSQEPFLGTAHYRLAMIAIQQGLLKEARYFSENTGICLPKRRELHEYLRGRIAFEEKDFSTAEKAFKRALNENSRHLESLIYLSRVYSSQRNRSQLAIGPLEQSLQIEPRDLSKKQIQVWLKEIYDNR